MQVLLRIFTQLQNDNSGSLFAEQSAGVERGQRAERIDEREQRKPSEDAQLLRDPAERQAHYQLQDGCENGHGRLRAAHEVPRNDVHERGLRDHARKRSEKSESI